MIDSVYFKQAELLLRILPLIDRETEFAMKGGTAINLFARGGRVGDVHKNISTV